MGIRKAKVAGLAMHSWARPIVASTAVMKLHAEAAGRGAERRKSAIVHRSSRLRLDVSSAATALRRLQSLPPSTARAC